MEIKNCKHCGFPPTEIRAGEVTPLNKVSHARTYFSCLMPECQEERIKKAQEEQRNTAISEWNTENNTDF